MEINEYNNCHRCGRTLEKQTETCFICTKCKNHTFVNPRPCTAVIIENEKNEFLLVKRAHEPEKGKWDLPGGFIEINETAAQGAQRELEEELGVNAKELVITDSYPDWYIYENMNIPTFIIGLIGKLPSDTTFNYADDVSDGKWFTKENIPFADIAFIGIEKMLKDYIK